ncbi:MAG: hypothetical protein C5B52_17630 [Bacteroidetes bacterium]|nr:MAG: hypothetical protein C5B52_17630 [Bacteroidota bacterium]
MIETFKSICSRKIASICTFAIALVGKWCILIYNFKIGNDKSLQLLAAKNIVNGNGLTINTVHASDISREIYVPLYAFPGGYSYLIAPFYALVRNLDLTSLGLDLVTAFFFLFFLRKLLIRIRFPIWLVNFSILFWGLNIPVYITRNGPTDFLSLTFCIVAIYLTITSIQKNDRAWKFGIYIGITLFILEQLRYLNIPASLIIPVFLFWNGIKLKNRNTLKIGLISLTIVFAGMILFHDGFVWVFKMLASHQNLSGNFSHNIISTRSWYPENLLHCYPFMADAFVNVDLILTQISMHTSMNYGTGANLITLLCLPLQITGAIAICYFILRTQFISREAQKIFILLGGGISISTLVILLYLSLKKDGHIPPPIDSYWTYIADGRYFAFISLYTYCTIILCANFLFKGNFLKLCKMIFLGLLCLGIIHGIWYVSKISFVNKLKQSSSLKDARLFIQSLIKNSNKHVVVTSAASAYSAYSIFEGGSGLFEFEEINNQEIKTSSPAILLAIIDKKELVYFENFIKQENTRLAKVIDDNYFYINEPETNNQK